MTVRQAVVPIGAVLVLGLGVYLFFAVRAQPAPSKVDQPSRLPRPAARAPQATAGRDASTTAALPPSDHPAEPSPGQPAPTGTAETPQMIIGTPPDRASALSGPKLDAVMDEANKAYDRGDFDDAKLIAGRVLARFPTNARMLRIMVSASCIEGDNATAQSHFLNLPPDDQAQMRVRCARYGVTFPDKP